MKTIAQSLTERWATLFKAPEAILPAVLVVGAGF